MKNQKRINKIMKQINKEIPNHYRQVLYGQNKPVSQEKKALRQAKRQERNQVHKEILQNHKSQNEYYNQQVDEWNKAQYYLNVKNFDYQSLNQLLSSTFKHAKRRQNIFPIVDRHPDYTLRCVYSGKVLSDELGNFLEKCDEEHSFPQSFQRGTKSGTGRDMHAIFAASKSANGSRGNTPFGIYSQNQVPIQVDQFGTTYSGADGIKKKTYIPKLNSGAVARSTLYILLCYQNCANEEYLPKQTIDWLKKTAATQQVTLWQKHRNQQLFKLQENRNPFIDYPQLAFKIDFTKGWQK